jgi:glycosyltransferase involved in cell wall biosynthesis
MLTRNEIPTEICSVKTRSEPTIALVPWGDVWEDYLDSISVSLETFCTEGPGGWMLGYIEALHRVGVRTVLILVSARVATPLRFNYAPTGTTITVLPAPKLYRAIHPQLVNPYLPSKEQELLGGAHLSRRIWLSLLNQVGPYFATPLRLLAKELRREGCRAILCQEYEYTRFDVCVLLGQLMRLPVFAVFQGGSDDPNRIGRFLRPLAMQACAGLAIGPKAEIQRVCTSHNLQPAKAAQIFNPVDLGMWRPADQAEARATLGLPSDTQIVVWHGRVEMYTKRLDVLLDAWEQVCCTRAGQNLLLLLIGVGQDTEKVRQRIAVLPTQNVLWVDKYVTDRTEIRHYLSAGDVYAFPSSYEGFPVAPIEAMACGLPLVAADASGVSDILEGGEASGGLLVPCGDVNAFARALGRILDNEAWRRELGKRARRRAKDFFSLEGVGRQLYNFFLQSGMSIK